MSAIVSPELVEQAWQRVGALDAPEVLKLQNRSGGFQPELVGFVLGFTSKMSPQGMGIALYAMLVLFEMFQRVPATTFSKVKDKTIMKLWRANAELTSALLANDFDLDLMRSSWPKVRNRPRFVTSSKRWLTCRRSLPSCRRKKWRRSWQSTKQSSTRSTRWPRADPARRT